MEVVDAVVIGAGPNGLVAANVLADADWDVLVLEATDVAGGGIQTRELTHPSFRSDLCSAFFPLGMASPVLRKLELERHGLRWRYAPEVLAHLFPDDAAWCCRQTSIAPRSPSGRSPSPTVTRGGRSTSGGSSYVTICSTPCYGRSRRCAPRAGGYAVSARPRRCGSLACSCRRFAGAGAQLLFAGSVLHTDLVPGDAGSALFGWLLTMLGQEVGFPVPEGGAGSLADALVRRLEARGGRVRCDQPVDRVLIGSRTAAGVRMKGGEMVRARRAVVADVPAPTLYLKLVGPEHSPSGLHTDLERFVYDDSTIRVDWALNGLTSFGASLACKEIPEDPFVLPDR